MPWRRALLLLLAAAPPLAAAEPDFTGSWSGWARLTNDWPGLACTYDGSATPGSLKLDLAKEGDALKGTLSLEVAPAAGSGCPPLHKVYAVVDAKQSEAALSFGDPGGHVWSLGSRQEGAVLKGLVAWKSGGPSDPLAADFTASGSTPMTRLTGEVHLTRAGKAAAGGGAAVKKGGSKAGYVAAIIGANVVAAGAFVAANKLGKGNPSGTTTCSPRYCFVGQPGQPCLCNANVLAGSSCGSTSGGVPLGGVCDATLRPCQTGFSCNAGVCQDGSGACPY
jgi:hypothetical protein